MNTVEGLRSRMYRLKRRKRQKIVFGLATLLAGLLVFVPPAS